MSLIDACADFTEAVDRSDVAAACLSLIEIAATSVKEHVPENAGPSLIRAIVIARARSVEEAVRSVRVWAPCEPLVLIDSEPWDPLCLLMFIAECHLRVCVTHLFSTKGGWAALGDEPTYDVPLQKAIHADEWRRTPFELEAGLEPRGVAALLADNDIARAAVALVVCFEGEGLGIRYTDLAVPNLRTASVSEVARVFHHHVLTGSEARDGHYENAAAVPYERRHMSVQRAEICEADDLFLYFTCGPFLLVRSTIDASATARALGL